MPMWKKINLMESTSPIMEELSILLDHSMTIMTMILMTTLMMMTMTLKMKFLSRNILENQLTETTWTILPAMVLLLIAVPSIKIMYMMEELTNPMISIKTIGHQWYWSYEYSNSKNKEMDSYMTNFESSFRMLDVDNRMIMPMMTQIRLIITSQDVIHSWTIPSLGIKMDAVPGRLNQTTIFSKKPGLFFGECSEICGTNHSFMPITIESILMKSFIKWMNN
uniref:cytochrome c oxidase subunit II n=1 Tax=Rhotana formosana TaxID=3081105 RepID=UPI002A7EC154|nr:cytochrome c oxidase subunit II [Rhotana formosana]WOW99128.1 cytochrome c oxidase subunit II [Rhotana formosana]